MRPGCPSTQTGHIGTKKKMLEITNYVEIQVGLVPAQQITHVWRGLGVIRTMGTPVLTPLDGHSYVLSG